MSASRCPQPTEDIGPWNMKAFSFFSLYFGFHSASGIRPGACSMELSRLTLAAFDLGIDAP